MLSKLAFRNVKRTIGDYFVYVSTISIAVALMFAMNSVLFTDNVKTLSEMIGALNVAILFVTVIVLLVISWLIYYIIKFMLDKRSKEFGTYLLLGIHSRKITLLFLLENFIIGCISLVIGIFLGEVIYQIILILIYNLFEVSYQIQFVVYWQAILITLICYIATYLLSFIRSYWYLNKIKVVDLMYADKKNESSFIKSKRSYLVLFLLSIVLIGGGLTLFHIIMNPNTIPAPIGLLGSVSMILLGIYGSYISFSSFVVSILSKREKPIKKMNIFLIRSLTSKVNTMSFTIGTISILLTFTFIFSGLSTMIKSYYDNQAESFAPFDVMISNQGEDDNFNSYLDYFKENNLIINQEYSYFLYTNYDDQVATKLTTVVYDDMDNLIDIYIKLSDYNQLRELLGEKPVELTQNQFLFQAKPDAKEVIEESFSEESTILVDGQTLSYAGVETLLFSQNGMNGNRYLIVVPDRIVEELEIIQTNLVLDTKEETTEEIGVAIKEIISSKSWGIETVAPQTFSIVRGELLAQNKTIFVTFSFILIFLSILFLLVSITILSIQQLSDSAKYKFRYTILSKIGVSNYQIKLLVLKQLAIYYLLPVLLPAVISTIVILSLNRWFYIYLESFGTIVNYILAGYSIFFFVYLIYFIITYIGFMKNIEIQ